MAPVDTRAHADAAMLRVEVVLSAVAREVLSAALVLPQGATVWQAAQASGLCAAGDTPQTGLVLGVWGRVVPPGQAVCDGDRIEVYRRLQVDPKEARRRRQQVQEQAAAGRPVRPRKR